MEVRLSDEELAAVVQRAHEISSLQGRIEGSRSSVEDYVKVAEEMGVPREAMLQALNERFAFLDREIETGQLVFARSADGRAYAAKVLSCDGDSANVRFLNGGESRIGRHELLEPSFSPGTTYEYFSQSYSCHVRAQVVKYDRDSLTVTFNTWGSEETVPLSKVRVPRQKTSKGISPWVVTLVSSLSTGVAGAIVTWLLMR